MVLFIFEVNTSFEISLAISLTMSKECYRKDE